MEQRLTRWRERVLAPPSVVSGALRPRALGGTLLLVAGMAAVGEALPGATCDWAGTGAALLLTALGVVVLVARARVPGWAMYVVHTTASSAIAVAVHATTTPASAVAWSLLWLPLLVQSALVLAWAGVAAEGALAVALWSWAATGPGASLEEPAQTALVSGAFVATCLVTAVLARGSGAAHRDDLTGLLNRRGAEARARELIGRADASRAPLCAALVDLDHFKQVNDALGHDGGDALLRVVAAAVRAALPAGADAGRWGGDEFVLLVPGTTDDALAVLDAVRAGLPRGRTISAGVAVHRAGEALAPLVQRADQALYQVKRAVRGASQVWGGGVPDTELTRALAAGEVEVHYQPVVALAAAGGQTVTGVEALVRWRRDGVLVPPLDFVPQAETSGAVVPLGRFVLDRACADAASWPVPATPDGGAAAAPLTVSVNASGRELADPDYAAWVAAACARSGLDPRRLVIEVVEGALDEGSEVVLGTLHALRAAGVRLAVDDFGTGWSNLSRLGRLPLDILKVDKSFLDGVQEAEAEAPVVASVLALARALDLRVVAEGVETVHQARWLRRHGCPQAQGFLWSPAVPAAELVAMLEQQGAAPAVPAAPADA